MAGIIGDIAAAEPAFTLERFEPDGERLEVAGHWRGLRGRRFVRPVLWLYSGEDRQRLVAVLDHKPWQAGEGDRWVAAFPWGGGEIEAERAELEVGRELVVQLPVPGGPAIEPQRAQPRRPTEVERLREQLAGETRERRELQAALDARAREADTLARLRAERDAAREEAERAREEAERARAEGRRLVDEESRQRQRALAAAEESLIRLREAEAARDLAERQLSAARASHAELEQRLAASEAAPPAPAADPADVERLEADLAAGRAERARLERELAAAWADRDRLEAEVVSARAGRERVEAELVAVRGERKRLERELAAVPAEPPARLPRRARATPPDSRLAPPREGSALWAVRAVALALVVLLLVAVALVLGRLL